MSLLLNKILDCLQDRQRFNPQAIGLNMSLPLNYSPINSGNIKFVEFLLPGSRYSDPVLFLPYVPGCINACVFNGRQDIVSAPFSGCHLVLFQYTKECFMEAIYGMGKSKIFCTYNKFGCVKTCPYHATFVAHVAYDSYGTGTNSSKNIWETLKNDSNCEVYIDYDPLTPGADYAYSDEKICGTPYDMDSIVNLYGAITCDRKCFNFAMKNSGEVCFINL